MRKSKEDFFFHIVCFTKTILNLMGKIMLIIIANSIDFLPQELKQSTLLMYSII